ncbi:hypothetical protein EDD86DRAFT_186011 [Gorgonomyces haynaldii]|nr:hypothetical protein EDD86DRAFT_186011 [Gorgonomyces haynaldii]
MYVKKQHIPASWTKRAVDEQVLDMLYDLAPQVEEKVALTANISWDLLVDPRQKYGFFMDILEQFEIELDAEEGAARDFASGKEAADWVASQLEETNRLLV